MPDPRHHIIRCAAALAGASYHDAPPSSELCDLWREMAANARQGADDMRAEIERLKSPAAVLAEAERLLRDALVNRVGLASTLGTQVVTYVGKRGHGATLAEAYEKLTRGDAHG